MPVPQSFNYSITPFIQQSDEKEKFKRIKKQ